MKNISDKIKELLDDISEDNNLLKYMYNRAGKFVPGKITHDKWVDICSELLK